MKKYTCWMIERVYNEDDDPDHRWPGTLYVAVDRDANKGIHARIKFCLTQEHEEALQFVRKQDAENMMYTFEQFGVFRSRGFEVREHKYA